MSSKVAVILTVMAVLGLLGGTSQAIVVIEHVGDNDPGTEPGWVYTWGDETEGSADTLLGEAGWRISGNVGIYGNGVFAANPGLLTEGWILEGRMAFLETPSGNNDTAFLIQDGTTGAHTFWEGDSWNVSNAVGAIELLGPHPGVGVWGDYRIEYDPAGDGGNGDFSFYLDDVHLQTRTRGELEPNGSDRVRWSHGAGNETIWSLVRLTEIPEPATLCLLGLGGLALLRRRR